MKKITETARLYLREMTPDDAENIYLLNLDPDVVKYTGDGPFESVLHAKEFLSNYTHYQVYGYGRWAIIDKSTEEFIGWCGLRYTPELDEVDLGFRIYKRHWNKGYSAEAAAACIEVGFSKFDMIKIIGRSLKQNTASIRVLEKIGMEFVTTSQFHGESGVIYEIVRSNGNNKSDH